MFWCLSHLFGSPNRLWIFVVLGIVFMSSTGHGLGLSDLCIVVVQKVMPLSTWFLQILFVPLHNCL